MSATESVVCKGPWSRAEISEFLRGTTIPVRLACQGTSGFPVMVSLWFTEKNGRLWCATKRDAKIAALLDRNPHCAFEVSVEQAPYYGVRGQAVATVHEEGGEALLRELLERYLDDPDSQFARGLLARAENEVAIEIDPRMFVSWDFRARMGMAS